MSKASDLFLACDEVPATLAASCSLQPACCLPVLLQHPCNRQHLPMSAADSADCVMLLPNMLQGGWARSVDVYCTGTQTCGVARTTTVTNMITTGRWVSSSTQQPNAWDVAVLRTAGTLPGTAITPGQVSFSSQPADLPLLASILPPPHKSQSLSQADTDEPCCCVCRSKCAASLLQYTSTGTARARLTGYTGNRAGVNGCGGYTGCLQYR